MSAVILAHLSDLHLPFTPNPALRDLLGKRFLSLLSWKLRRQHVHQQFPLEQIMADIASQHPDALAIAGDLTNLGLKAEFRKAAEWTAEWLARLGNVPTAIIPGNHDAMVPIAWQDGPGRWIALGGMEKPDMPSVTYAGADGSVALIGVNSAVPTPPFFASGRVGAIQIERLGDTLSDLGRAGVCRVVMIHHPPHPDLVVDRKALKDISAFAQTVGRVGAELVLHGHSHRGTFETLPSSSIPLIGVTSASHIPDHPERAAGWNRIAITAEADTWRIVVEPRRLGLDGQVHGLSPRCFTRPRLSTGRGNELDPQLTGSALQATP